MSLLSIKDVSEIRTAIKSVTDTFFTLTAVIGVRSGSIDPFNEDREDDTPTFISVKCLEVMETSGTNAMAAVMRNGSFDFDKGYVLINVEDMKAAGLLFEDGTAMIEATRDTLMVGNEKFDILGINPVGFLVDAFTLFKIHIERSVKSS